ncbi:MAG TPA: hypothetical protein VLR90_09520, partial [Blastocatellia bacterium]|nr:hypothetical protein [Blastocatellia bacterium]
MKDESHITRDQIRWSVIFAGWTLIGLFFISRNIVTQVTRGQPLSWYRPVLAEMLYWQIWALFTAWVFRFLRRH